MSVPHCFNLVSYFQSLRLFQQLRGFLNLQELAMQEERAEAQAEIAELQEQLKRLSAVEGAWADQVAQGEELHLENVELQRLVSKLHGDLFQSQSLNSEWQLAARATARKVAEKLLEFQRWSLHELKLCFLTWRLRTAARCAELAERARLRMQHVGRIERIMVNQSSSSDCGEIFRAWVQYKDQHRKSRPLATTSTSRIHIFRSFSAWRRLCISMSYLRQLRWCEPSTVCTPEFASAVWQELRSPRVYRSFLLSQDGSVHLMPQ